jgi:lysophospholipase L1-like esterase
MNFTFPWIMLVAVLVIFVITKLEVGRITKHHYLQRADFFRAHPALPGDIIFMGDSLTAGGNWDEIFPGMGIKNRGINADLTTGLQDRLDCVTQGHPAAIFILIGTNDLPWYEYRTDEMILDTYKRILDKIKNDTPETKVFVESLLPRAHSYAKRVKEFNSKLKQLAENEGVTYIDLYSHFVDSRGDLRAELNNDHLHLLAQGYLIWAEQLLPYLETVKKPNPYTNL